MKLIFEGKEIENNQTVKTIKSFHTVEEILEYCSKIECTFTQEEVKAEIEKRALVKYGSILILFDPYCLLD
jgi:hypothetical protein